MAQGQQKTLPLSRWGNWQNWLPRTAVFVYLLIALIAYIIFPLLAVRWINTPFIGAFIEQTMMFNTTGPSQTGDRWAAHDLGLTGENHQLIGVGEQRVQNSRQLRTALQNFGVGNTAVLNVRTPDGSIQPYSMKLVTFPNNARIAFFYLPYFIGLIYLVCGIWLFSIRRNQKSGRAFAIFCTSVALAAGGLFDLYTTHYFTILWTLAMALIGGSFIAMAFDFPQPDPITRRYPILQYIGYLISLVLFLIALPTLYDLNHPQAYFLPWRLIYIYVGISLLFSGAWLIFRRLKISSPIEREQMRLMVLGSTLSFGLPGVWFMVSPIFPQVRFSPYLMLPLVIFPLLSGYTVQRYRLVNTDYVLSRGMLYGIMAVLIASGYALAVSGAGLILVRLSGVQQTAAAGLIIFALALAFNPLRQQMENMVNGVFFRGERAYQERLQTFSGELTRVVDLGSIVKILRQYLSSSLQPSQTHIYLYDSFSDQYLASQGPGNRATSDLRFSTASGLVQVMHNQRGPIFVSDIERLPTALQTEQTRLSLLGAQVFVPLPGHQRLTGFLALGERLSGEAYTSRDLTFLEALCDQAVLAIERAQVVANVENRVREMNVLTRVAQGINITLTLDDILELIYAQTSQIIPSDDYQLILTEAETNLLMPVFIIERDERIPEKEQKPVGAKQLLEQEVIRMRRPLVTDDYSREAQQRGIILTRPEIFAWMCVPLNAGAETIGALSLGSRDQAVLYTRDQMNLLQAVADQAAGAIVKARLLQEAERRARQLAMLNDLTRQLTSTLDLEPLLQNILKSAAEILNCEAGSLLLVDPQTDELVFRVTVGPVAVNLIDQRLPPGSGVVGKAVKEKQAIIVNNVQNTPEWFAKTDENTGFSTRALLVIPLQVKDHAIGVIEVINRKDGLPFTQSDESLLSAFAAQAAVAIENARLYTMTDQALEERVEELSVMQRIDRELNTSLDASRAMHITLEWAMRQSRATAGLVGLIGEQGIQITASDGYDQELAPYQDAPLPTDLFGLQDVINSGKSTYHLLDGSSLVGLRADARSQIIVPIQRETRSIGLIILESVASETPSEDTLNFLMRLSDHASIAIANAQLYAAVQAANLAKSEFVSFVAHELKNPMTSVKGFTDLLSKGVVGPINEMQSNFLNTITSNIDRMNTLVSDLNDVSKLEVGRLRLDFKSTVLPEVVEEVVRSTRRQIDDKGQELSIQLPTDLPAVWADRGRLTQVLVNLVSNANKYTQQGGHVILSAEACDNRWDEHGARRVVHLWVKDDGIGIAPEDQKKIFQKFFRSEDPKTREAPGTGLGLNITRSLVEMQGGVIWFDSEFRKGSTFHITIPIAE